MTQKFQLSLSVTTLILTAAIILFGGVYLFSLENKYAALLHSPAIESEKLNTQLDDSQKKIAILEAQVRALQDNLIDMAKAQNPTATQVDSNIESANKLDVFIDSKCFEDPAHLDQCLILADATLSGQAHVVVKPAAPLTDGINKVILEFYNGEIKLADYTFATSNLFKTEQPIATIVYANANDITIQIKTSPDDKNTILNFDGEGWIEYRKSISQIQQ